MTASMLDFSQSRFIESMYSRFVSPKVSASMANLGKAPQASTNVSYASSQNANSTSNAAFTKLSAQSNLNERLKGQQETAQSGIQGLEKIDAALHRVNQLLVAIAEPARSEEEKQGYESELGNLQSDFKELTGEIEDLGKDMQGDAMDKRIYKHVLNAIQISKTVLGSVQVSREEISSSSVKELQSASLRVKSEKAALQSKLGEIHKAVMVTSSIQSAYTPIISLLGNSPASFSGINFRA